MPRCSACYLLLDDLLFDTLEDDPITLPKEVQEILYEMTLRYLLEKPDDVLSFCSTYMKNLKESRKTMIIVADKEPDEVLLDSYWQRRHAIYSPHPEELEVPEMPKSYEEKELITRAIADVIPFKYLDSDTFRAVVGLFHKMDIEAGRHLTVQGEPSKKFYLIESGQYTAYLRDGDYIKNLRTYENSGYLGELALLYESISEETVLANSVGEVWVLEGEWYRNVLLNNEKQKRSLYESLLDKVSFLSELTGAERAKLVDCMSTEDFQCGERVQREGDEPERMYFVASGRVTLSRCDPEAGVDVKLRDLEEGSYFGERVLVCRDRCNFTAHAIGPTRLAFLRVEDFERLVGPCLQAMKRQFETFHQNLEDIFDKEQIKNLR